MEKSNKKESGNKKDTDFKTFTVPFPLGGIKEKITVSSNVDAQISIEQIITKAFNEVYNKSHSENINYRLSALSIGLDRVIHTAGLRGYI